MTRLTARQENRHKLASALQASLKGKLQIIFVTGEAGIGKTALVENFVEEAQQLAIRRNLAFIVAASKCHSIAGGQQDAYLPFEQILTQLINEKQQDTFGKRLRNSIAEVAPDWIAIIPVVGSPIAAFVRTTQVVQREFGNQGNSADASRLAIQFANALHVAAEQAPLLLWIDDIHWSDNATLDLISFLADQIGDARIMLIATYRPTDVKPDDRGQSHAVKKLVDKLKRYGQCTEISLALFTRKNLDEYLTLGSYQFPVGFVDRLYHQSGGNPLFINEYVALLHDRKTLRPNGDTLSLDETDIEIEMPDTVASVIHQRLEIEPELRRTLAYASIQGDRFASGILAHSLNMPEIEVLDQLNRLEHENHLVHEVEIDTGPLHNYTGSVYQFVHVLVQEALYQSLSKGQRRHLHLIVAKQLQHLYGNDETRYASDLAIHFERGADLTQAIQYYLQSSRNAVGVLALDDAIQRAQTARKLTDKLSGDQRQIGWHLDALVRIIESYHWKAEVDNVMATFDEGMRLCGQGAYPEQYASLLYWRALTFETVGRYIGMAESVRQALVVLNEDPPNTQLQGHLYALIASFPISLPQEEVQHAISRALIIAQKHNLPDVEVNALMFKAYGLIIALDDPKEGCGIAEQALGLAVRHQMMYEQSYCHRILCQANLRLKHGADALMHANQAIDIASRYGLPIELQNALRELAIVQREVEENWKASLETIQEASAVADRYKFPIDRSVLMVWSDTARGLGLWNETLEMEQRYLKRLDPDSPRMMGIFYRRQGITAMARGLYQQALELLNKAKYIFEAHSPSQRDIQGLNVYIGLSLLSLGDIQQGRESLQSAHQYWQSRENPPILGQSLRGLAAADLAVGNILQAITRLRLALQLVEGSYSDNLAAWAVWPHISIDLGRALLSNGDLNAAMHYAEFGYQKALKWRHFLLGEAAFVVGQILVAQAKTSEALPYFVQAHDDWERLDIRYHLPDWQAFVDSHKLFQTTRG